MAKHFQGWEWLDGRRKIVTSQNGEDGLIEAIFEKIGTTNRWCFEVGASDGKTLSNTWALREQGWSSVQIEGNIGQFSRLNQEHGKRCSCVHATIGRDDLDGILDTYAVPDDLDFGVVDIDGQDYHVWDGLVRHRPRVILIEADNPSSINDFYVPPLGNNAQGQAKAGSLLALGESKGYTCVFHLAWNLFFVRNDVLSC